MDHKLNSLFSVPADSPNIDSSFTVVAVEEDADGEGWTLIHDEDLGEFYLAHGDIPFGSGTITDIGQYHVGWESPSYSQAGVPDWVNYYVRVDDLTYNMTVEENLGDYYIRMSDVSFTQLSDVVVEDYMTRVEDLTLNVVIDKEDWSEYFTGHPPVSDLTTIVEEDFSDYELFIFSPVDVFLDGNPSDDSLSQPDALIGQSDKFVADVSWGTGEFEFNWSCTREPDSGGGISDNYATFNWNDSDEGQFEVNVTVGEDHTGRPRDDTATDSRTFTVQFPEQ